MNLPAILSDDDLAARLRAHAAAASGSYADATIQAIRSDVAKFTRWCVDTGLAPLPAYPETVAASRLPFLTNRAYARVEFGRSPGNQAAGS